MNLETKDLLRDINIMVIDGYIPVIAEYIKVYEFPEGSLHHKVMTSGYHSLEMIWKKGGREGTRAFKRDTPITCIWGFIAEDTGTEWSVRRTSLVIPQTP